ncbi:MAG: hypothetical protein HW387_493 [Parachlamydiales bacterium]|nr:hypothetical protein [Parachlamydiales bacterium]
MKKIASRLQNSSTRKIALLAYLPTAPTRLSSWTSRRRRSSNRLRLFSQDTPKSSIFRSRGALQLALAGLLLSGALSANPIGPTIAHGAAELIQKQNALEISCSDDLIINWQNFGIDVDEKVTFIQPSQNSFVLNRVTGLDPSHILGALSSNGALFLINPNGILIGERAKIDVGSLLASTLNIKDDDFLQHKDLPLFSDSKASIVNQGQIESMGDVYLIAKTVDNQGNIVSENGKVSIGAGVNVLIKPQETESLYIMPDLENSDPETFGVSNSGLIQSLQTEIKTSNSYALAIKHTGQIEAVSLENRGGDVYLVASNGRVDVDNGTIVAKKGNDGGQVKVLGKEVVLQNQASIDVSNIHNGGNVFVGGGKQGKDPQLLNAQLNFAGKDVVIDASSQESGNGGDVVLWADGITSFYGTVYSQGGAVQGDGGFVEVSGLGELNYRGFTRTTAMNGHAGTLLLDPSYIIISTAATSPGYNATIPVTFNPPTNPTPELATNIFNQGDLQTALIGGNVIISTAAGALGGANAGDIQFGTGVMAIALTMTGAGYTLTLNADRDILIPAATTSVAITFPAGGNGELIFNATRHISILTPSFTCTNAKTVNLTATTGNITNTGITAAQTITFSGGTPTFAFSAAGAIGIALGGATTLGTTINLGTPTTVSMSTTGAGGITLGNSAVATTAATSITMGATGSVTLSTTNAGGGTSASINLGHTAATTSGAYSLNFGTPTTVGITTSGASANITLGSNATTATKTITFGTPTAVNITTNGATADIIFGNAVSTTGATTLSGGSSTIFTASAKRNISFITAGTGAMTFTNFGSFVFSAVTGDIINSGISAAQTITFSGGTPTFLFSAAGATGIALGGTGTFGTTIDLGTPTTVGMSTTGAGGITLGNSAASTTAATSITMGATASVNLSTTGASAAITLGHLLASGTTSGAYSLIFGTPATVSVTTSGATAASINLGNAAVTTGTYSLNFGATTSAILSTGGSSAAINLGHLALSGATTATYSMTFGTTASATLSTSGPSAVINLGNTAATATSGAYSLTFGTTGNGPVSVTTSGLSAGITLGSSNTTGTKTITFGTPTTVNITTTGLTADIIFGHAASTTGATTLAAGSSTILNASAGQNILFSSNGTGAIVFNPFSRTNFTAPVGSIYTNAVATGQAINFTAVSRVDLNALIGINIGSGGSNTVAMTFTTATAVNMTTTVGDVQFYNNVGGAITLTGNPLTVLTATAGNDIRYNLGTGALTFATFASVKCYAANLIQATPLGTGGKVFTGVSAIEYRGNNGISIGQGATAFNRTVTYGNPTSISMSTVNAGSDITLGGTGTGNFGLTGGPATIFNILPVRNLIINGTGVSAMTFTGFNTVNLYAPSPAVPTSAQVLSLLNPGASAAVPGILFTGVTNLNINPYSITFLGATQFINILTATAASITTQVAQIFPSTLTMTDQNTNLTITSPAITVNRRIVDTAIGSITLNALSGDITVESTVATLSAQVGVLNGNVTINSANSLHVYGNTALAGVGSFAQIGFDLPNTVSDIYLNVPNEIHVRGGLSLTANARCYALIGHGGGAPAVGNRTGDIIISPCTSITVEANDGDPTTPTSGTEGAAHIGHFILDPLTVVGLQGDIRGVTPGSRIMVSGAVDIDGGVQDQATALIGHGASSVGAGGNISIDGNIYLQCQDLEIVGRTALTATGEAYAGIGHKIRYSALGAIGGSITGSVDVKVLESAFVIAQAAGGAAFIGAYSSFGFGFDNTTSMDLSLVSVDVGDDFTCLGGTTTAQENKALIGVWAEYAGGATTANTKTNLYIRTGHDFSFLTRLGESCYISSGQAPSLGRTTDIIVGRNFYLMGEASTAALLAIDTLSLTVTGSMTLTNAALPPYKSYIQTENTTSITVGNDLFMQGSCVSSFASNDGYAYIRNNAGSGTGAMTIIVGQKLMMNPISRIQNAAAGQPITIVVDNMFPTFPQSGMGAIHEAYHDSISTSGNAAPIRIFTSMQSLNTIDNIPGAYARINGQSFTPGTEFVDTAQEVWGTYYPNSYVNPNAPYFTFFYKNSNVPPVPPVPPAPTPTVILQIDPSIFEPDYEMFHKPFGLFFDFLSDLNASCDYFNESKNRCEEMQILPSKDF